MEKRKSGRMLYRCKTQENEKKAFFQIRSGPWYKNAKNYTKSAITFSKFPQRGDPIGEILIFKLHKKTVFNSPLNREFYYLHYLITHIDMSYNYNEIIKNNRFLVILIPKCNFL